MSIVYIYNYKYMVHKLKQHRCVFCLIFVIIIDPIYDFEEVTKFFSS